MVYDKEQVLSFLPHRNPFLFIDEVLKVEIPEAARGLPLPLKFTDLVGGKTVARFFVDDSMKVLEGHFPGSPIVPGVVQVEMMAQASCFLVTKSFDKPINEIKVEVALLGVDKARFRKPVVPPMELTIETELVKVRGNIMAYDCKVYHQKELVSEASILATIKFI